MPGWIVAEPRQRPAAILLALALFYLLLALPSDPGALAWSALLVFPLELPVLAILLVWLRGGTVRALRIAISIALPALTLLKLADLAGYAAFLRPVNPALDWPLAISGWQLASGAIGVPLTLAAVVVLVGALILLGLACWWASGILARLSPGARLRFGLGLALLPAVVAAGFGFAPGQNRPADSQTSRLAWDHLRDAAAARTDLARFRVAAAEDPRAAMSALGALQGTDIFLIFVESYGRTTLDNPLYAPTTDAVLRAGETELAAHGLAAHSAFLTAPMVGGQSWLAHGTLLSGLRLDTEGRYRALLASPRKTLLRLAQSAGWRTVAAMPAITLPWPEATYFGYDRVLAAKDLQYRGLPFNWVTMPDQFTLVSLERQALTPGPRPPVFAEIALISSHAPWTPIPPLLPWDALGDGSVFDPYATAGDPPDVLWRDPDRVRDQYRLSIAYALRTVVGFAARRAATKPLFIVLGDHQPAAFVSQEPTNRDVPIHLIGAPETLARLDPWGWTQGLIPTPDAPVWPMETFRDRFLDAFATPQPN